MSTNPIITRTVFYRLVGRVTTSLTLAPNSKQVVALPRTSGPAIIRVVKLQATGGGDVRLGIDGRDAGTPLLMPIPSFTILEAFYHSTPGAVNGLVVRSGSTDTTIDIDIEVYEQNVTMDVASAKLGLLTAQPEWELLDEWVVDYPGATTQLVVFSRRLPFDTAWPLLVSVYNDGTIPIYAAITPYVYRAGTATLTGLYIGPGYGLALTPTLYRASPVYVFGTANVVATISAAANGDVHAVIRIYAPKTITY